VRRTASLIALITVFASTALAEPKMISRAEDHLEPDASALGGGRGSPKYDMELREALGEAFFSETAIRMIAMPAFVSVYAVGLRKMGAATDTPYHVVALTLANPMKAIQPVTVDNSGNLHAPPLPWKQDVTRCEISISGKLGDRIVEIWRKMLMRTRYPAQYTSGVDGAVYEFSMFVRGLGDIAGHIWLPDRNSSTGALVTLGDELYGICTTRKDASMDQLEKLTAELEHRLN